MTSRVTAGIALGAGALLCATTAFAQVPEAPPRQPLAADQTFVAQAAASGIYEFRAGQLAQRRGSGAGVKEYGQLMQQDHSLANTQLVAIAKNKNIPVSTALPAQQAQMLAQLQRDRGSAFDRDYAQQQVMAHQQTIALFQAEIANGNDADIKAFAANALPELQMHLKMAQQVLANPNAAFPLPSPSTGTSVNSGG